MDYQRLKERQRAERGDWPENLGLRVHRALSWLQRAEQLEEQHDLDGQFIFLWIAFNAAYATEIDERYRDSEQQTFRAFLAKLDALDAVHQRFEHLVWTGERRGFRRLTEGQAACGNAGTLTCRSVRRGAGVSRTATNAEEVTPSPVHKRSKVSTHACERHDTDVVAGSQRNQEGGAWRRSEVAQRAAGCGDAESDCSVGLHAMSARDSRCG